MQFYEAALRGKLHDQQVIQVFWYRATVEGLPQQGDREQVAAYVKNTILPALRAVQSNQMLWEDVVVNSYRSTWEREPYLSHIETAAGAGVNALVSAPPLMATVLACRVEPVVPGRQINPKTGLPWLRPVRRGYWSLAGVPDSMYQPNGTTTLGTAWPAEILTLRNALKGNIPVSGIYALKEPIRVSKPLAGEIARGYGLIKDVVVRDIASTRRSRKRGKGA
jgi:hypothetical protein